MALWLSAAEVEPLLDLDGAMNVTAEAFKEQSAKAVAALAASMLRTRKGMLRIVTGALLDSRRMGVRLGPAQGYTDRIASDKMLAALYDAESGELLSVMGYPFGTLRTGATVGLATRLFARDDARVAGLLGTGRNALSLLKAVCHVRPIEHIRVFSPNPEHRQEFVGRASQQLDCEIEAADTTEAATQGADVLCVATNALSPVVTAQQLSEGTFVATMGRPSEIDPSVYLAADLIVVGNKEQEGGYFDMKNYTHQLLKLVDEGKLDWASGVQEMCDVVAGRVPKRTSNDQLIVFKESQGGFGDVAFANHVYEQAKQLGLGREVPL
jgi:ornithine cyclodeaminase/alanine dehydrogenase-like protein (mu-crystallin family)